MIMRSIVPNQMGFGPEYTDIISLANQKTRYYILLIPLQERAKQINTMAHTMVLLTASLPFPLTHQKALHRLIKISLVTMFIGNPEAKHISKKKSKAVY